MGPKLFHADGRACRQAGAQVDRQTHMTKLIVVFCNLADAPKNGTGTIYIDCIFYIRA